MCFGFTNCCVSFIVLERKVFGRLESEGQLRIKVSASLDKVSKL